MPSSYSPLLRATLPANGENSGTWGTLVNEGITALLEDAIAGYVSIAIPDANVTLTVNNGIPDQARKMLLRFTGTLTAARNVVCPSSSKVYFVQNAATQNIVFKTVTGVGVTLPPNTYMSVVCDGVDVFPANTGFQAAAGTVGAPSHSFVADPDTGMYNPSANVLSFALGGVSQWTMEANSLRGRYNGDLTDDSTLLRVRHRPAVSTATIDIQPDPLDGLGVAQVRFFRTITPGTGGRNVDIFRGDNTGTIDHRLSAGSSGVLASFARNGGQLSAGPTTAQLATEPAYTFQGDQDTGVYRPAADQVGVSTGGVGRAIFTSTSNGYGPEAMTSPNVAHRFGRLSGAADPSFLGGTVAAFVGTAGLDASVAYNSVIAGRAAIAGVTFGDQDSPNSGGVLYDNATDSLTIRVNGVDRETVNSSGARSYSGSFGSANQALTSQGTSAAPTWGPIIESGSYTPTATNITNVAASIPNVFQYLRVGSTVTVSGTLQIDATAAANTVTQLDLSLPIASNFTSTTHAAGTVASFGNAAQERGGVFANVTDDRLRIEYVCVSLTANATFSFHATYRIL